MIKDSDVLNKAELKELPSHFLVVDRNRFHVYVWERAAGANEFVRNRISIRCATGAPGFRTPPGPYIIQAKARHPDWQKPYSAWVPKRERGQIVKGRDPANPIKEAFLKLSDDGIGIHGTSDLLSLGRRASHGCIRVSPRHAAWLYKEIPAGSPVLIK